MIIDTRKWLSNLPEALALAARVFVDGQEVQGVYYVDTELGIAKSFFLNRQGEYETKRTMPQRQFPRRWGVEYLGDGGAPDLGFGPWSRTHTGVVSVIFLRPRTAREYMDR